jgi:hypothetical protein
MSSPLDDAPAEPDATEPEEPFQDLDWKIERINVLRSLVGQDFVDPDTAGVRPLVIEEVNRQISDFLLELLNTELGRGPREKDALPPLDAERSQALEWLLSRIVSAVRSPDAPATPAGRSPAPTPIEPVANPQVDYGEPSVHTPLVQSGAAIARPSTRGSGIMDLLKQGNPDLIAPNDPARAMMTPQQKREADQIFNSAVRDYESKKKAEVAKVEKRGK